MNITSKIPREVEKILCDLSVVGNLPTGSKFNSETQTYAAANSYIDAFLRTFYRENVNKSIDYINKLVDEAILTARKYPAWFEHICTNVLLLDKAVNNLMHVYSGKPATVEKLKIILLRIDRASFHGACFEQLSIEQ